MRRTTPTERDAVEALIVSDVQALSAESDDLGREFCARHDLGINDFRALLHVMVAEADGDPLTQSELGRRIGVSGAAITYLVDRMVASGHLEREAARLRPAQGAAALRRPRQRGGPIVLHAAGQAHRGGAEEFSASDLTTAHHVLLALIEAMRVFRTELRE